MNSIEQLETDLWAAADNLRANSKLTSSEYSLLSGYAPVGLTLGKTAMGGKELLVIANDRNGRGHGAAVPRRRLSPRSRYCSFVASEFVPAAQTTPPAV